MTQKVILAEALLRRKELQNKVEQLKPILRPDMYALKISRKPAAEGIDDIVAEVPKLTASQVTAEHDFYARQLRLVDGAIQRANWNTEIEVSDTVMQDYQAPK